MSKQANQWTEYDLKSVKLPHLSGLLLRLFVTLLESPLGSLIAPILLRNAGITWLREQQIDELPTLYPIAAHTTMPSSKTKGVPSQELPESLVYTRAGFHFNTVHDYVRAYQEGKTTPIEVANKLLKAIEASDATTKPLRAFITIAPKDILKQAEAATKRIKEGSRLSDFDGVPIAVKDQFDMVPYPTTFGTAFLGTSASEGDSTIVARIREVGAILIGKANMHEMGMGVTGFNPHHGTTRNPYDPDHYTGGSSSGSAAAVAAGFCPVAIGADGGGSIRIPASFCGLVGLKPTFGRVSRFGANPLGWSLDHFGPLAATATDAALIYAVVSGPDQNDPTSLYQPAPIPSRWNNLELTDLTLGVYWPWFHHASADTVSICEALLHEFERMGATIQEITIPDLEAGRVAHVLTLAAELGQIMKCHGSEYRRNYGLDVRISLALAHGFDAGDYIQAQRVRTRMIANFSRVLEQVDVIVTPTTGLPAPIIPKAALAHGDFDMTTIFKIMRFITPANFTGLPAISFPAGYNNTGLPIGMQAIGRYWHEHTLLRLALAGEQMIQHRVPKVFYNMLED
jgi:Asp-tRNA(Asn)/Glu-tRNA(Gln) amidotransferase A subunit family amidase